MALYLVLGPPPSVTPAATPTFAPAAGTYSSSQTVTISDTTPGASIYFTNDGSTPSVIGGVPQGTTELYSGPVTVSSSETLQAIALATGFTQSAVGTAAYVISGGSFQITTASLPNGTVGGTYFNQIETSGGVPPILFGQIGPNYFGGFNYSVNVPVSAISQTANAVFTLNSSASTHPFTGQTQCMVYPVSGSWPKSLYWSGAITALGGSAGAWTVTTNIDFSNSSYASNLLNCALVAGPTGVNPYQMTLTGMLEGVLTTAETASLPIIAVDNTGAIATKTLSLTTNSTLAILGCDLSQATQPVPNAMVGNAYQHQFYCAGGSGVGQTWSFSGLPSGLTGNSSGLLSGTPLSANSFVEFIATVTDSVGPPVSAYFTMSVLANANGTRPSYNTGTGFYVANAKLYDPGNAPFRIRGMNQDHYDDTGNTGLAAYFGCNTLRIFSYLVNYDGGYPASAYTPIVASTVAANILPMFTLNQIPCAGINGATITGTAGQFSCPATNLPILVGQSISISGTPTGTGSISGYNSSGTNNYVVSVTNGSTTFTLTTTSGGALTTVAGTTSGMVFGSAGASGNTSTADLQTCGNWIAANYSAFSPTTMFNIANEWNGSNSVYQSAYESAVATIRAAGCTNPLVIDANGRGQNYQAITSYGPAIQASDPQQNCIFSFHAYGATQNIQAQITAITKGSSTTTIEIDFTGPYNPFANYLIGDAANGVPSNAYISGVGGMTQINGLSPTIASVGGSSGAYTVTLNLNSSAFSNFTSGGTIYSSVNISEVIAPALAALASSNVCCIVGELGPGKNIGTNSASPTSCTNAEVVAACEANGLGWMYWAIDDNDLASNATSQTKYGCQLVNSGSTALSNLTYVGLDAAWNPNTGVHALATPASYYL